MTRTAARARRRVTRARAPRASGPTEEPGGADGEDERHGREKGEIRELGEERLPEIVEEAHEQAARHRPGQATEPAHDDHHEGVGQHFEVGPWIDTEEARADDPAEGGESGAQT